MDAFEELINVIDRLLGPEGCPWDREQTMSSIRHYLLEEASELIDAIDLEDNEHIKEELGDLFFHVLFLSRLAEKENRFHLNDVIKTLTKKLIRRHPHVFGETKVTTSDEVLHQWEQIKKKEKGNSQPKSVLDGIPKSLPALARAAKVIKKIKKTAFQKVPFFKEIEDEEELGSLLWRLVADAENKGLDAEQALRKILAEQEKAFRKFERAEN